MSTTEHVVGLAIAAACAVTDKKTGHLAVIDVSERLGLTNVFLLASGANDRHVHAIADAVDEVVHRAGAKYRTREGSADAYRILVDYGDAVVHVLQNEGQEFYLFERLWKNCPAIEPPADLAHEGSQDGDLLGGRETTAS